MNIVFFGASNFGLKCLESIYELPDVKISGVLTGQKEFNISYSKNKKVINVLHADFGVFCQEKDIPIIELQGKMNDPKLIQIISSWKPEIILVIGWYHMVPKTILNIPPKGTLGMHASLLPYYRGGAPLVWAILQGERKAGISLFYFDEGVDTGDIVSQKSVIIKFNDTIKSVYDKIENAGIELLKEMLPLIARGVAPRNKQNDLPEGHLAVWKQRSPDDGIINWSMSVLDLYNFIRAQTKPYPGAFTSFRGKKLIIWSAKIYDLYVKNGKPGEILSVIEEGPLKGLLVATNDNDSPILLTEVQIEDKLLSGVEFAKEYKITIGEILS